MTQNFFEDRVPPAGRRKGCGGIERHVTEGAVMMAIALYLFEQGASEVRVHPDGEHGKRFDFAGFLGSREFSLVSRHGKTTYGGVYVRGTQKLVLQPKSGLGDVVATINGTVVFCEAKGGVINTSHAGQVPILKRRLCEAVGQLFIRPVAGERHIAVVPKAKCTEELAARMISRVKGASIEIALVDQDGRLAFVGSRALGGAAR